MKKRGKYIVIEGHDGTGKTSQRDLLVAYLKTKKIEAIGVHEPGETKIGLELERVIKDRTLDRSALSNLLLFTANRIELWQQVIEPALASGVHVIADRNWISSAAYQGFAEGLGIEAVEKITKQFLPDHYIHPDLTLYLTITKEIRAARLGKRGNSDADTFESKGDAFQQKILDGYQAATPHIKKLVTISADPSKEDVQRQIWQTCQPVLVPALQ